MYRVGKGKAPADQRPGRLPVVAPALVLTSPAEEGRRYLVTEVEN